MKTNETLIEVEKELVGKNLHSVYTHCLSCHSWGINMPLNKVCGNCGKNTDTYTYYDSETIASALQAKENSVRKETLDEVLKECQIANDNMVGDDPMSICSSDFEVIKKILSNLSEK